MAISLETQEIIFAFEAGNKDNYESWGKYELDELQDAYAEMPEEDKDSTTGQRIKDRIKELESGEDQVQELRQEEEEKEKLAEQQSEATTKNVISEPKPEPQAEAKTEVPKQKTPIIIGGMIIGVVILMLVVYFLK
jgi:outer membrane biosynthesis protein TonB